MDNQPLGTALDNDLRLVGMLIHKTFRAFMPHPETGRFEKQVYFSFCGIEQEALSEFYGQSLIRQTLSVKIDPAESFILLASIAPHYLPDTFLLAKYLAGIDKNPFSIIGGKISGDNGCFYPTGETLLFLLAGLSPQKRIWLSGHFSPNGRLLRLGLLEMGNVLPGSSQLSGQLIPKPELISVLKGEKYQPAYSKDFPATLLETRMEWEDLVLPYSTYEGLEELKMWMKHGQALIGHSETGKRIKPGYRCLFYGPPGTGKTLTASLIGKAFRHPVYRIDLSMVVSKWVGETEKNLGSIFDQAANKDWVLFFDEADSLFGKRTHANSSNDRFANQEVSYLLQRIEDFPGLVILASNLKSNIDDAFNRRFQSTVLFPIPDVDIRHALWQKAFPKDFPLEAGIDLKEIAKKYEMAGGAMVNVVRYCTLKALDRQNGQTVLLEDLEHAIIREFKKEGKIVG